VNKGLGSYRGPGPRQLKASFPDIVAVLRDMAVDPNSHVWDGQKAEAAAWLSFRELVRCLLLVMLIELARWGLGGGGGGVGRGGGGGRG